MQNTRITFIGGGNMARALLTGLLRQGASPAQLAVGEPLAVLRTALEHDFGIATFADNVEAVRHAAGQAGATVLAVKPQEARSVLTRLAPALQSDSGPLPAAGVPAASPLLLSIAAGLKVSDLQRWCPGVAIVRAMPNRPALMGAGVTGLYARAGTAAAATGRAEALMRSAGSTVWVEDEALLDVVTAVSGSGPAYFFLLAEQLADAGTRLGLSAAVARQLAAETLYGAGQLAHADSDLERQREAVTSRGGTTAAALAILQNGALARLIHEAVTAAARRSEQLSQQLGGPAAEASES